MVAYLDWQILIVNEYHFGLDRGLDILSNNRSVLFNKRYFIRE